MSMDLILGQLMLGLINGSLYAVLALGFAIIFGILGVVNLLHGTQYMLGALGTWIALKQVGMPYWTALFVIPLVVAVISMGVERTVIRRIYRLDHIYGALLTLGLALVVESICRRYFGSTGLIYPNPIRGGVDFGFLFVPAYRLWVVGAGLVVSVGTWLVIERTSIGAYLRAAKERPDIVESFGVNVPMMQTMIYGFGGALAAFCGVLAAPIFSVNPTMGSSMIAVLFAIVVVGGLGSLRGAIIAGLSLGIVEGLAKLVIPQASSVIIFVVMALMILIRPAGLAGVSPR